MTKEEIAKFVSDRFEFYKKYYKLTPTQQNIFDTMKLGVEDFGNGWAGGYNRAENTAKFNRSYFDTAGGRAAIDETVFHELDHARSKGLFKPDGDLVYQNAHGDAFYVRKGIALSESVATYNGSMAKYAFHNQPWKEEPHTNRFFPRHKFPSGYWWYQQSGNFHSQLANTLGISDLDFCHIVGENNGRQIIEQIFAKLTGVPDSFDMIENQMDFVHTVQDRMFAQKTVSPQLKADCDKKIDNIQEYLAYTILNAYKTNKITEDEFVRRHNGLLRYISSAESLKAIKEMAIHNGIGRVGSSEQGQDFGSQFSK